MPLPVTPHLREIFAIDTALLGLSERMPAVLIASLRIALTFAGLPAPFGGLAPMRIRTLLSVLVTMISSPHQMVIGRTGRNVRGRTERESRNGCCACRPPLRNF